MKRTAGFMTICLLLFGMFISGCHKSSTQGKLEKAPDFTLKDLAGNDFTLSKEIQGKVAFVNFWATWCPPCRMEIPSFIEMYQKYKDKGFVLAGISLDQGGIKDVLPFVNEKKINYPILLGNDQVAEAYGGIRGIPTTFMVNKNGQIVNMHVGYMSKEMAEEEIKKLLGIQ